jgi:hypothetical protein
VERGCVYFFIWEAECKAPFGRLRHRMVGNIKTDIQETRWRTKTEINDSGHRHVAGNSKHGEPSGLIKCAEFVAQPTNNQLLKKESTPCICVKKNQLDTFFTQIY